MSRLLPRDHGVLVALVAVVLAVVGTGCSGAEGEGDADGDLDADADVDGDGDAIGDGGDGDADAGDGDGGEGDGEGDGDVEDGGDADGEPVLCAEDADFEALGYLPVTDRGADPTGSRLSTAEIQSAIDEAYDRGMVVFFPSGTYLVDDTLDLMQRDEGQNREGHMMVGSYCGPRPVIRLLDGSPGFGSCAGYPAEMTGCVPDTVEDFSTSSPCDFRQRTTLKPVIVLWRESDACTAAEQSPDASEGGRDWNNVVRNLEIVLGDNPGSVGIRHGGAEGASTQEVRIDATGGFAGIYSLNSSGGYNYDIEVVGGRHGIYATRMRGGPPLVVGLRLSGQTEAPLVIRHYAPVNVVGFDIEHESGPIIDVRRWSHDSSGHIALIDGRIDLTGGPGPAITNTDRSVYLRNVFVRGATTILANGSDGSRLEAADPAEWSWVEEHSSAGDYEESAGEPGALVDGVRTDETYVAGALTSASVVTAGSAVGDPPADLIERHLVPRGLCHVEDARMVIATDLGARPDDGEDDTAAIQAAIDRATAEGIDGVFLPFGVYQVSGTLLLGERTRLCGASRTSSVLDSSGWEPASPRPVLQTVDSATATTAVAEVQIGMGSPPVYAVRWMAGRRSIVRDLYYPRVAWENDGDRQRAIITGHGGGRWYGVVQHGGFGTVAEPEARHLLVDGTTEPLTFYSLHCQHLVPRGGPQCEVRGAANVTIYSLKSEMTSTPSQVEDIAAEDMSIVFGVNESAAFFISGVEGMIQTAPDHGLFEVRDSHDVTIVNLARRDSWARWDLGTWYFVREDLGGTESHIDATHVLRLFRRR